MKVAQQAIWLSGVSITVILSIVAYAGIWSRSFFLKKRGCPGWGANPGPLDLIYFLIFTTLPLSCSGSPITITIITWYSNYSDMALQLLHHGITTIITWYYNYYNMVLHRNITT
jgi:hypothetical protein